MACHSSASLGPRLPFLAPLFLVLSALGACGDDGEGGTGGAGSTSTGSTTGGDTTSASTTSGGAGGSGTGGGAVDCEDAAACAYPSKGLEFSERELVVEDAETGRELPVVARIPDAEGPLPLVIWSHGGGFLPNVPEATAGWSSTFAQQGYAVLTLAHIAPTAESGLALCELASIPPEDCVADGATDEDATGVVALVKTRDVIAVLDALPGLSDASVAVGGPAIDLDRVIVAGWSAGSRPGLVTLGATFLPLPGMSPFSMADVRPAAAFALSPAGPGFGGFYEEEGSSSWSDVRGPVLVITGDNDVKPTKPDLSGPVRRRAFENQPEDGSRWMLYSSLQPGVGGHGTYNLEDRGSDDERLADLSIAIESTALAFVDANVMGDAEAEAWLASDKARLIAGEAEWVHH